jgi:hypothetical protein
VDDRGRYRRESASREVVAEAEKVVVPVEQVNHAPTEAAAGGFPSHAPR